MQIPALIGIINLSAEDAQDFDYFLFSGFDYGNHHAYTDVGKGNEHEAEHYHCGLSSRVA